MREEGQVDAWTLYHQMLRARRFEEQLVKLWEDGLISGEFHSGLGEEAIAAGIICQLEDDDAIALDHRGTPPLVIRGVDPVTIVRELLGKEDGLCGGMGGHMHLFSKPYLMASSGIVGAAAPAAAGFALSRQQLCTGKIAVAFFGEGAMNQGMVLESLNLAVVWNLPVLFVCKDNDWSITTRSPDVTGGELVERAKGFGMKARAIDGSDVKAVYEAARNAIARVRHGGGPFFLLAHCTHLEGHFLGDPMLKITRRPIEGFGPYANALVRAISRRSGASLPTRGQSLLSLTQSLGRMAVDHRLRRIDPLARLRHTLIEDKARLEQIEQEVANEMKTVLQHAQVIAPLDSKE